MIRVSVRIYFRGQINFLLSAGNSSKHVALRSGYSYGHTHYEAFTLLRLKTTIELYLLNKANEKGGEVHAGI